MPNNDEIIAAYIREKKPELLDTLSFLVFSMVYTATKAVKSFADAIGNTSEKDIAAVLSESNENEECDPRDEEDQAE